MRRELFRIDTTGNSPVVLGSGSALKQKKKEEATVASSFDLSGK